MTKEEQLEYVKSLVKEYDIDGPNCNTMEICDDEIQGDIESPDFLGLTCCIYLKIQDENEEGFFVKNILKNDFISQIYDFARDRDELVRQLMMSAGMDESEFDWARYALDHSGEYEEGGIDAVIEECGREDLADELETMFAEEGEMQKAMDYLANLE